MPKLLINVTDPQDAWLREKAAVEALPGGVSELIRRIIEKAQADDRRHAQRTARNAAPKETQE